MSEERDAQWAEFERLGEEEVRKRLGAQQYGEAKVKLARAWLEQRDALHASADRRKAIDVATEANTISRQANDLSREANTTAAGAAIAAREAADATKANARIAAGALAMAFLALVVSVLATLIK
jgi:hypothetical protein